ncbi:hypothetical protein RJ639_009227 [Escallonia herrerae]|uniref:F-box/LRR-repeat protein 15-like leucin rich repeat domain-containing protein n=1 Tax=Escallonia herrerae TaxID=1293975 RepID=A0AA88VRW2_9ASTE|nr:hypothetical protein RJ639_009227 [Escallonia herrerae]
MAGERHGAVQINETLRDDELRAILARLDSDKDKEVFGLVCKRWLHLQSTDRRRLCARAGPHMLRKIAARFTRILELDLSQSVGITDAGMVAIGSVLSSLQSLDVSFCRKLTDKGLSAVTEGCRDLRSLYLTGCKSVTDALLRALSLNCQNLEVLGLEGCTGITDSGLVVLVDGCHKMKHLDINKCINVGDSGVASVSKACSLSLKTLKLMDCYKLGDISILSLARFCINLETLAIGGCRGLSDESMKSLAAAPNHNLRTLRMDWCSNLSDSTVKCLLSQCKNLEVLDIGCCEEVTDAAFQGLSNEGNELVLKFLKVTSCPKITVAGISMLLESCKSLQYLDVRSCPLVTEAGCDEAGVQFPKWCKVNYDGRLIEPDVLV